ncbi:MAG: hypothetical protein P0Y53_01315 [Candidatus Pseudobacter hemicellulosilyticus]|uniref:Uncharacterized protein n=1 Tax=Candidatus Pseudobacter hemicellulosilyticus TaxID=3121375 RepID=A0AAJ6BIB9_9BACT|nr:MAG: hypothetical protein P0Y53_01315 [Pseudobacter sp.]
MQRQTIVYHHHDQLIGDTLISHFDLVQQTAHQLIRKQKLSVLQDRIWQKWLTEFRDFSPTGSAHLVIDEIQEIKRQPPILPTFVNTKQAAFELKKAFRAIFKIGTIRNKLINQQPLDEVEDNLWRGLYYTGVPHAGNPAFFSTADLLMLIDLETSVNNMKPEIDWAKIALIYPL